MKSHLLTAAPCPLVIQTNDEEIEFLASPLSDRDWDSLDLWVQSQVVSITRASLKFAMDEATEEDPVDFIYEEEMQIANKAALGVSIYEPAGIQILNTPRGAARLGWLMTIKNHPDTKFVDWIRYCRKIENNYEIRSTLAKLNPQNANVEADVTVGNDEAVTSLESQTVTAG